MLHFLRVPRVLRDGRPDGDLEHEVFARAPVEKLPATVTAVFGLHFFLAREGHERIDVRDALKIHVGTAPAVPCPSVPRDRRTLLKATAPRPPLPA